MTLQFGTRFVFTSVVDQFVVPGGPPDKTAGIRADLAQIFLEDLRKDKAFKNAASIGFFPAVFVVDTDTLPFQNASRHRELEILSAAIGKVYPQLLTTLRKVVPVEVLAQVTDTAVNSKDSTKALGSTNWRDSDKPGGPERDAKGTAFKFPGANQFTVII